MLKLYAAANLQDAHLLRYLLAEQGIEARVFNENAQGGVGELPFTHTYPELWLEDEADLPRARRVIADFENKPPAQGTLRCAGCGEDNPATFEICWHCGKALD